VNRDGASTRLVDRLTEDVRGREVADPDVGKTWILFGDPAMKIR
jgi:hypothetical protein